MSIKIQVGELESENRKEGGTEHEKGRTQVWKSPRALLLPWWPLWLKSGHCWRGKDWDGRQGGVRTPHPGGPLYLWIPLPQWPPPSHLTRMVVQASKHWCPPERSSQDRHLSCCSGVPAVYTFHGDVGEGKNLHAMYTFYWNVGEGKTFSLPSYVLVPAACKLS